MHTRQMDGAGLEEKNVLYILSKVKTTPWKMYSEADQSFFGDHDLVGGRLTGGPWGHELVNPQWLLWREIAVGFWQKMIDGFVFKSSSFLLPYMIVNEYTRSLFILDSWCYAEIVFYKQNAGNL